MKIDYWEPEWRYRHSDHWERFASQSWLSRIPLNSYARSSWQMAKLFARSRVDTVE